MQNYLRQLRSEQNVSQEKLASQLQVSRQTINAIENDRYEPSLTLALKLARYFQTPVEKLFIVPETTQVAATTDSQTAQVTVCATTEVPTTNSTATTEAPAETEPP